MICPSGKIYIDVDAIGKMDPYVKFEMLDEKKKVIWKDETEIHDGGHQDPKWKKEFKIKVNHDDETITFKIYDKDVFGSDFIGSGEFNAKDLA